MRQIKNTRQTENTRWDRLAIQHTPALAKWTPESFEKIFEERGITEKIRGARDYAPYSAGEMEVLYAADPKYAGLPAAVRSSTRRIVNQRPGIVIPRYPIPGAPALFAQLRPFKFRELDSGFDLGRYGLDEDPGVCNGTWAHKHVSTFRHKHTSRGAIFVGEPPRTGYRPPAQSTAWLSDHIEREHDVRGWGYATIGELRMVPGTATHVHSLDWTKHLQNAQYVADHVESENPGRHLHAEYAKYVYVSRGGMIGDTSERPAKVIDIHPMALRLLEAGGRRCFFCLEGVLKNDAVLSTGEPVINCGSVTLWDDPALWDFAARYLARFEMVVIVPDSDWIGNLQVADQAHRVTNRLVEIGIQARIAAPEATCSATTGCEACIHPIHRDSDPNGRRVPEHKNGVDDWLGSGGTIDELVTWETTEVLGNLPLAIGRQRRSRTRNQKVLEYLCREQTPSTGRVRRALRHIGNDLHMSKDAVWRALQDWQETGYVRRVPPKDLYFDYDPVTTVELSDDLRRHIPKRLGDI